ncbi:MAG TPA: hypothetical protein DCL15_14135 [Chloroflexi bacterium]|nr:hypothetical protein [Chloroflexota bacterium]
MHSPVIDQVFLKKVLIMKRNVRLVAWALLFAIWLHSAPLPLLPSVRVAHAEPAAPTGGSPFATQVTLTNAALGAHSVTSADFDRDGRLDLLTASREDGQIIWFRKTDWNSLTFQQRLLTIAPGTYAAIPADINRDGYMDVVAVAVGALAPSAADADQPAANDGSVFWLLNNLPASAQFTRIDLGVGLNYPVAVHSADIDRDGDVDVLVTTRDANQVLLYENSGVGDTPSFTMRVIDGNLSGAVSVTTGDIDSDGKLDILAAGENLNQILWYRNNGARPAAFTPRFIRNGPVPNPVMDYAKTVATADLDKDGDLDVIFGSEEENLIGWYENQHRGATFIEHVLVTGANHVKMVAAGDPDRDGDLDIIAASSDDNTVHFLENDGQPTPTFTHLIVTSSAMGARSVHLADFDRDGDPDLAVASRVDNTVALYLNTAIHRSALMESQRVVNTYSQTRSVATADIDGDGRMDVLSTANNIVAWHRNLGGSPPNFESYIIDTSFQGGRWVTSGDLNGDGDVDIIAADRTTHRIIRYENLLRETGSVSFQPLVVASDAMRVRDVNVADLDNDGDLDLYSATDGDNTVAWYENLDGSGAAWSKHIVTRSVLYPRSTFAADLDGDGWLDLMSASAEDDSVTIYRQTAPRVFAQDTIYNRADGAQFIYADDIDGDTDKDIIVSSELDNTIAWFANRPGLRFERFVVSDTAYGVHAAITGDMDADGDKDIIAAIEYTDQVIWYENGGGFFPTWTPHLITPFTDVTHSVFVSDIDADGDLDVLSASRGDGKIAWYENRGGQFGFVQTQARGAAGTQRALLDTVFFHRGRVGDPPMALQALTLRFEDQQGRLLTAQQAADLFNALLVYVDNGDGVFSPSNDNLIARTTTFPLNAGMMTIDAPGISTAPGNAARYFVVADQRNLTCSLDSIHVTVLTNRRTAVDLAAGRPLLGEFMRNLNDNGDPNQDRKPAIVINEIMADNRTAFVDPDEPLEFPDWFELYNASGFYIDMGGMYLTDDATNLRKYRIPDGVTIAPNDYLVFIADGEPEQGPLHVSFNLSKDGETLVLYDVDARGNQAIDQWTFDSMEPDQSYGRSPVNASAWVKLDAPTPGKYNQPITTTDFVYLPAVSTINACY